MSLAKILYVLMPVSGICLASFVGVWAYSGTPFPPATEASENEMVLMWAFSAAQVIIPAATVVLLVLKRFRGLR
jgi:hypothetical protein